jgi:O-antigen ligase
MMAAAIFLTLVGSMLFLTISGGGLFPITVGIVAIATSALACVVTHRNSGSRPHLEISLALILLFILITALPLPPALDALAGSLRHQQNQAVVTSIHEAAQYGALPLMEEPWFCLSRNRAGTLRFFLLLAAAISACLLTAALPSKGRLLFLGFLALLGTGVGIAGHIGQWKIPQGDTLWWFIPVPHAPTSPVGCFLNRNHFGGFVAMLCPVALALAAHSISTRRWVGAIFYFGLTSLMGCVVFMSLSRGAMLAMAVGLVTTALIITFRHRLLWGGILLCLMAAGSGLLVTQSPAIRTRLAGIHNPAQVDSVNSRLNEWKESLRVWPHYPILGAGANALRMVYPQYRQTSVGARLIHAENEYIQLVAECGLLGVGLVFMVAWSLRQRLKQASARPPAVIITAVSGALSVTAIHCIFDFPAHLPIYALVLGALVGLLLTPVPETHPRCWLTMTPALIALLGTIAIACYQPSAVRTMDDPNYLYKAKYRDLHRALIWAPTSSAWLYLGRTMFIEGSIVRNGPLCSQAESLMTRAATLDPQNYWLWYEVGQIRLSLDDKQRATEAFQKAQALRSWMTPPVIPGGSTP